MTYQYQGEVPVRGDFANEGQFNRATERYERTKNNTEGVMNWWNKNIAPAFDFNNGVLNVSTRQNVTNKYEETITPAFPTGEPATVEFSSPIYAFFEKDQMLNFYMRDDFPLLVVANDRMLLKAPHISG